MKKTGIILFNLGGPTTLKDVRPFLFRLFSDEDILIGIPKIFRLLIALMIALFKGKSSIETYRKIGNGSPQLMWTRRQVERLSEVLIDSGVQRDAFKIVIGMRASRPDIEDAVRELKGEGVTKVIFMPLFPHFSTTTTGSCFKEARKMMKKWEFDIPVSEVVCWPDSKRFIDLMKTYLSEHLHGLKDSKKKPHILFSAHSLPRKIVEKKNDPYEKDVQKTVRALTEKFDHEWSLAYQSRNGKMPWLEPYTEDELDRLGKAGKTDVVVFPISFVSDHIETLYELDMLYADHAKKAGIENYSRVPSFNDDIRFAEVLRDILLPELSK